MTNDFRTRATNVLLGMALADAVGWPAMYHRSRLLPAWTRRIRREMDAQRDEDGILRIPMPFSLNQPPDVFDLYPTDDTEWAAWMMTRLMSDGVRVSAASVKSAWTALSKAEGQVRGGISTRSALDSIRQGTLPPASGRENPHYFDDGAISRAIPIGVACASSLNEAITFAGLEADATNTEDGVWVAQAAAAGVGTACSGGTVDDLIKAAVAVLPKDSWSRRVVTKALTVAKGEKPILELVPTLAPFVNVEYSDGCAGPETLALSLALVSATKGSYTEAVLGSLAFAKSADGVPPLVAALAGGLSSKDVIPSSWKGNLRNLRGVSVPLMAGRDLIALVDQFITACEKK